MILGMAHINHTSGLRVASPELLGQLGKWSAIIARMLI